LDQQRLNEFLQKHCVRVHRSGRLAANRLEQDDDGDGPRWRALISDQQNLVIIKGQLQPTSKFLGVSLPGPSNRPPGRPPGSPNLKGRKLSWELPKIR
jgi:hypothetical protein